MKIRYIAIGLLALAIKGKSQLPDSLFKKTEISKTDIEILYNMYGQDGDHSAVTGGKGTEKLNVYAPSVQIEFNKSDHTFSLNAGSDLISSASVDKIDDVISSASRQDLRTHAAIGYQQKFNNGNLEIGSGAGFSLESDYLAFPVNLNAAYTEPNEMREYSISLVASFDDLRWGRLNPDYQRPVTLVYPKELRDQDWFKNFKRQTFHLATGFQQVINQRMVVVVYPEIILQQGLLSTPFHRIVLNSGQVVIEKLPNRRVRIPISVRCNYYAGKSTIIKVGANYYHDDFGIDGKGFDLESAFKIAPKSSLSIFGEIFSQNKSTYFKPYKQHIATANYYTSDFDLSSFTSFKTGLGYRWSPFSKTGKRSYFRDFNIRYAFYHRSDKLYAHMLSASFRFTRTNKIQVKGQNR